VPSRALTDKEIKFFAKKLKIPHFRGVYMRENLLAKPHKQEVGVINLDKRDGVGIHWVAYKIRGGVLDYFDSYGNLPPPKEIMYYARNLKKLNIT
jgi:hypothetical protein